MNKYFIAVCFALALLVFAVVSVLYKEPVDPIERGLQYLSHHQEENGGFLMHMCSTVETEQCDTAHATGFTAGVISFIDDLDNPAVKDIKQKAFAFLLADAEAVGTSTASHATWKLFARRDPLYNRTPANIDDTAFISSLLIKNSIPFPKDLSALSLYEKSNKLFPMWFSPEWNKSEWARHAHAGVQKEQLPRLDYFGIDCVVNADILNYFVLRKKESPALCSYLNDVVEYRAYPACTFYFQSSAMLFYTMLYDHVPCLTSSIPRIREELLSTQRADGAWSDNIFLSILSASALYHTGYRGGALDRAVKYIKVRQEGDGGWPNASAFPDLAEPLSYGSRELTTAAALNLLGLIKQ